MYKSKLQELCHQQSWSSPEYRTAKSGVEHNPRFTSTVTINGVGYETPPNHCRSSKEAQNLAAHLAFEYLSKQSIPALVASVNANSGAEEGISGTSVNLQSMTSEGLVQDARASPSNTGQAAVNNEILHTFKNRLQQFTQKHNLSMPAYCSGYEGPPHAPRFRSKVIICDKTYESSELFPTLKEAEHAAAKVALETLSHDDIQEDERLYKPLLQELAQKKGLQFPRYCTDRSGPSHVPTFLSTVEIGTNVFQGVEAKTKKQAEISAAKVAYNALLKRKEEQPPSGHIKGISRVTSLNPQSAINEGLVQDIGQSALNMGEVSVNNEILHTFKNRLQQFTQKHNLSMPAYCSRSEGPPHAFRFRSKVIISDKTYESSEFFPTLKEAEHAAAKVALETLSHNDIQEDERLYKPLLQELAQKKGLQFPRYCTDRFGPSHVPTFLSTVEIGTDVFQGVEAKTKKQAEMSAAEVAYNALVKRKEEQGPSGCHIMGISEVASFDLQSTIIKRLLQDIAPSPSKHARRL